MGMYTELIFGAELKKETPNEVIEALKYMLGEIDKPDNFPLPEGGCEWLFQGGSYYFAIHNPVNKMWFDDISGQYHISTRSNLKNYADEIETFLDWVKPYIAGGSGAREMYAITISEEQSEPTIYYLED